MKKEIKAARRYFFLELMRLFCEEVHLETIFEKFIRPEIGPRDFELSPSEYEYLEKKTIKKAYDLHIPYLVAFSNFKHEGEEEFSENLAQIFCAMEEMELSDHVIKKIVLKAEKNSLIKNQHSS